MTDERLHDPFETDLRAVLTELAPGEVPGALRSRVTQIPFETARASRRSWLPQRRRLASAVLLLAVIVVAGVVLIARQPVGPGAGTPTPHSSLISSFVEQTDGVAGYRMLRPTNWTALGGDPIDGRSYVGPGPANAQQGIVVTAMNLKVVAAALGANTVNAQWLLFQQDSSLVGWTAGIEAMWARDGETFTLLRTLPNAKIYMLAPAAGSRSVFLVAYAIDQGQPLILELQASGTEADLSRLEAEGIVDDFATMAGSITAIPADPQNVVPPLPSGPVPSSSASPAAPTTAIIYQLVPVGSRTPDQAALATTVRVLTARAQGLGITGATVTAQPPDEVVVTVPVAELDVSRALGETGLVQFIPLPPATYGTASTSATGGPTGVTPNQPLPSDPGLVPLFDSSAITTATTGTDQNGAPVVDFTLSSSAASAFATYTAHNVGNYFAIVLDGTVISAPSINSAISGGEAEITVGAGGNAQSEVESLVTILKFGALPFPIREIAGEPGHSPGAGSTVP